VISNPPEDNSFFNASFHQREDDSDDQLPMPSVACIDPIQIRQRNIEAQPQHTSNLTYKACLEECKELCRTVQHDKQPIASVMYLLERVKNILRRHQSIHVVFLESTDEREGQKQQRPIEPLSSVSKTNPKV
jgi:hypothetical protein